MVLLRLIGIGEGEVAQRLVKGISKFMDRGGHSAAMTTFARGLGLISGCEVRKRAIMGLTTHGQYLLATAMVASLTLSGCTHIGPNTVKVDRFDYSSAISDSWKQQTLLNIVKLRYMDLPVFVDVSSIVASYSLETGGSIAGQLSSADAIQRDSVVLGASGKYIDRPTITYVPLTGEKFLVGLLSPIDPKNIFSMLQSGYAADFILALTVESLNGVRNRSAVAGAMHEADPEFLRVLELLREIQAAGAVGMRVEEDKAKGTIAVLFMRRDDVTPDIQEKQGEARVPNPYSQRQGKARACVHGRALSQSLVLDRRQQLASEACVGGCDVFLHTVGNRWQQQTAGDHHPGAVAGQTGSVLI